MIQANSNTSESEGVGQTVGQVVHDIVCLAELQVQLFKSDAGDMARRYVRPIAVFSLGVVLLLATLPVGLIALALGLVALGMPPVAAYGLVVLVSLGVAIAMAAWAKRQFFEMPKAFARSQEELARNISWIKDAVRNVSARHGQSADNLRTDRFGRS